MKENKDSTIYYLPNRQIDKQKWDACILSSSLPLIYATSVYLDGMCRHWDALILGDYLAVMPLPWSRKWLINYAYSPYFIVAGGVFGKVVSAELVSMFIEAIPKQFRYVDINLNESNYFSSFQAQENTIYRNRRNTLLFLNRSYKEIYSGFSSAAKRKLKKASGIHFTIDKSQRVNKVVGLYKEYYKEQDNVISRFDFSNMTDLLTSTLKQQTRTYILSFPNGEIAAFYLLLFDDNFVYWLIGGSTEKGKMVSAFYSLTNIVIRDFADTKRVFRFEGSDHEGIHLFNAQFGGETAYYPHVRINRLPWPFRYLK